MNYTFVARRSDIEKTLSPKVFSLYVYAATVQNLSGKVVTKFCALVLHCRTNIAACFRYSGHNSCQVFLFLACQFQYIMLF
jgi:hypothetical protein